MKLVVAAVVPFLALFAQPADRSPSRTVTAVRHWITGDTLRIAVEVSGDFQFHWDRLHNPERIYFDILNSRPSFDSRRSLSQDVESGPVRRIRVAETTVGVTRLVLDLNFRAELNATQLHNPNRLVVELRPANGATAAPSITEKPPTAVVPLPTAPEPLPAAPAAIPKPIAPPVREWTPPASKKTNANAAPPSLVPAPAVRAYTPRFEPLKTDPPRPDPPKPAPKPEPPPTAVAEAPRPQPALESSGPGATEDAKPARRTSAGVASLTRALGLKLNRVVIDPGHGGHDQGTAGPNGLLEKELVLDVSLRLGRLIEDQLGAEVIYTRTDDNFVALERRPQFANDKKADLFLSVHANSSAYPNISGVETYILNFTDNRTALDVAMRENASAQKPISELRDIIQQISAHDKAQESREFAGKIQAALYAFSTHNFPGEYNRGVKQAPFVVLIGTTMPAILTEIGFVTNTKEEALLKKPEYRQKLAEAIFHGVSKYAESLSHFQLAQVPSGN
jgi:N-acetylmuramoyl-L-alanine amidase